MDLATILEQGNSGGNLLPGEPAELDDSGLRAKVERHDLHHLIATVQLDDHPAAMDAIFTAPFHERYEVRAKLLDRSKRLESRVVLVCMGQLDHVSRHAQLPCSGRVYTGALGENQHSGELASIDGFAAAATRDTEDTQMGVVARLYTWVPVSAGIRTRIAQGPLVHAAPVQWLEFGHSARAAPITFSVTVYSAAAPWYLTASGTGTFWTLSGGGPGSFGARDITPLPWDAGFPLWLLGSPWIEVYVVTNRSCFARLDTL